MVSFLRSAAWIALRDAQAWPAGSATMKGSSYTACIMMPGSENGCASSATSMSPLLSISSRRKVKFSSITSGMPGAVRIMRGTSAGSR